MCGFDLFAPIAGYLASQFFTFKNSADVLFFYDKFLLWNFWAFVLETEKSNTFLPWVIE